MHLNLESVSQYTQFAASLCWLSLECCHYSILFIHKIRRETSMMRSLIIEIAGRVGDQHQILNFSWPKSLVNLPCWETRWRMASWRKSSSSGCSKATPERRLCKQVHRLLRLELSKGGCTEALKESGTCHCCMYGLYSPLRSVLGGLEGWLRD